MDLKCVLFFFISTTEARFDVISYLYCIRDGTRCVFKVAFTYEKVSELF